MFLSRKPTPTISQMLTLTYVGTPTLMDVTCVYLHTHTHIPVPLCQLMATPSAVMLAHSRGDSHRTSSTLTDTFLHWRAIIKPTWSPFQRPCVLEARSLKLCCHPMTLLTSSDSSGTASGTQVEPRWNVDGLRYRVVSICFICGWHCARPTCFSQLMSWACIFVGTRPLALEMRRRCRMMTGSPSFSFCSLVNSCKPTCTQHRTTVSSMAGGAHYMDDVRCNSCRLAHLAPWSAVESNGILLND